MKKSWILLAGAALGLSSCVANIEIFSAFNLRVGNPACVITPTTGKRQLNLLFSYSGALKGVKMTFTPNSRPSATVTISDLKSLTAGFEIDTLTSNTANILVNLNEIMPDVTPMAIQPPVEKVSLPMDVKVEAITTGSNAIKLEGLSKVDVSDCYPPKPVPVNP